MYTRGRAFLYMAGLARQGCKTFAQDHCFSLAEFPDETCVDNWQRQNSPILTPETACGKMGAGRANNRSKIPQQKARKMNNGVDLVSGITDTKEPKETNNSGEQDWYQSLLSFAVQNTNSNHKPRKRSIRRTYQVIRRKDGITSIETNVGQIRANKLKTRYHAEGFSVDLIEECNLTGEIVRSAPSTAKIPCPVPYTTTRQKVKAQEISNKLASLRAYRMSNESAKLNARRDRNKSYVYDRATGFMVFAGDVESAIDFIIKRMENGIWRGNDWIIYLPKKYFEMAGGVTNG